MIVVGFAKVHERDRLIDDDSDSASWWYLPAYNCPSVLAMLLLPPGEREWIMLHSFALGNPRQWLLQTDLYCPVPVTGFTQPLQI